MKKKKSIVLGMTIAAVLLIAMVGSASANCIGDVHGTVFGCGATVTESCTFNAPMTCSGGEGSGNPQHGLIIGADDIVINGDIYTLTGGEYKCTGVGEYSPQSADCGILNYYDNVTIKNLEVENFCTGIALLYAEENTVHHCNIHHNGNDTDNLHASATNGMHLITLDNSTIRNNWIHDNVAYHHSCDCGGGGNGIFQMALCDHNDIVHNNLTGNQKAGFFTKMHCTDNDISYNNATGNGLGGIILRCMMSNYNRIEENNASDNCGVGMYIRGSDNLFRNNTVMRNMNCSHYHTTIHGVLILPLTRLLTRAELESRFSVTQVLMS
jgi:parallel beta-helix repeat protein